MNNLTGGILIGFVAALTAVLAVALGALVWQRARWEGVVMGKGDLSAPDGFPMWLHAGSAINVTTDEEHYLGVEVTTYNAAGVAFRTGDRRLFVPWNVIHEVEFVKPTAPPPGHDERVHRTA